MYDFKDKLDEVCVEDIDGVTDILTKLEFKRVYISCSIVKEKVEDAVNNGYFCDSWYTVDCLDKDWRHYFEKFETWHDLQAWVGKLEESMGGEPEGESYEDYE